MAEDKKAEERQFKIAIKASDMLQEMQDKAIETAKQAIKQGEAEKDVAAFIKKDFDSKYGKTWHCVVGRNFGSFVTHDQLAVLLFKTL